MVETLKHAVNFVTAPAIFITVAAAVFFLALRHRAFWKPRVALGVALAGAAFLSELAMGIGKAWGTYLKQTIPRPHCAIGTDARLSNHMLKSAITAGLLSTGCDVVDAGLVPTPTLQYTVKEKQFDAGIIITASHNPPQFNGIKETAQEGIELSKDVEEAIETIYFSGSYTLADWRNLGRFSTWGGAIDLYIKGILSSVDVTRIKKSRFHVALDCGNGAGCLTAPMLLKKLGCTVTELNREPDGRFPGRHSEPIPENLTAWYSFTSSSVHRPPRAL